MRGADNGGDLVGDVDLGIIEEVVAVAYCVSESIITLNTST
jgi:hypothetical protein